MNLEEMFADEPYLSPTMKAQRLHEKRQAGKGPQVPPLPVRPMKQGETVGLAQAAEVLRAGARWNELPDATLTRLFRFRETVLRQWLAAAPEMRSGGELK